MGVLSTSETVPRARAARRCSARRAEKETLVLVHQGTRTDRTPGRGDGRARPPAVSDHACGGLPKKAFAAAGMLGGWCQVPPPHRARRSARGRHRGAVAGGRHSTTPSSSGEEQRSRRCCMRTGRRPIGRGQRSTATRIRSASDGPPRPAAPPSRIAACGALHRASRLHPRPNPRLKTCEISSIRFPHHKIMRSWGTEYARGREVPALTNRLY